MLPRDLTTGQTWAFVASRLRGAKRILEVGCGDGALARHLATGGAEVTALDLALTDRSAQHGVKFVEQDFLEFDGSGFDAVLFTSSLHHIHPLSAALDRALAVLNPGGTLLAEEFAVEAPDESTARWYYGMQALLSGPGAMRAPAVHVHAHAHAPAHVPAHHDPEAPPLDRWRSEHEHEPPLHTAKAMLDAITSRFTDVRHATGPYLYRSIAATLPETPGGGKVALRLFERENEAMKDGRVKPVGRRFHALRPR